MNGNGVLKSFCTFEMLNYQSSGESCPDIDRGFFVAFLFPNDIAVRRSFLFRNGLNTIALDWVEQRIKDDRRIFLCRPKTKRSNKVMLHKSIQSKGVLQNKFADEKHTIYKSVGKMVSTLGVSYPSEIIGTLLNDYLSQNRDLDMKDVREMVRAATIIMNCLTQVSESCQSAQVIKERIKDAEEMENAFDNSFGFIDPSTSLN